MVRIDVHEIFRQELSQSGDSLEALRGTRSRVHEVLQASAGPPPHFASTRGEEISPGHPGKAPSSTEAEHAAQKKHHLDLWAETDRIVAAAKLHDAAHAAHMAAAPADEATGELAGTATMLRNGGAA